jgi:hypothetical protein
MKKKNVLALQKLSSKRPRGNNGGGESVLSVTGCGGDSGISLLGCD